MDSEIPVANREVTFVMSLAEPVRLAEGQVAASGAVLARAFADDPFFTSVLSDPSSGSASRCRS